jgi:3-hydroxyisobutyrate dehydrogenase-like beta-hydroxyacid dehydrogenase
VIAVIGLGNIGIAMAERLVAQGREVLGVDLSAERRAVWAETTGLTAAASLDEVPWEEVTHVLVIVRLTHQAEAVLRGLDDLLSDGTAVAVSTTLDIEWARKELPGWSGRRWRLVEMPVSGGEYGAREGTLTLMVAGDSDDRDTEFLSDLGSTAVRFPEYGQPTVAKLLNNVSAAYTALAYAEMMLLADRVGMDAKGLAQILTTSSGGSWMGDHFMVLTDDLLAKDVELLRSQVGALPVVALNGEIDLVGRLEQARALLR